MNISQVVFSFGDDMKFDRKKFWDNYRRTINPNFTKDQVEAVEFLLDEFESDGIWSDIRHIAYALATIRHETAYTYEPIQEIGSRAYFERRYGHKTSKGRELGNDAPGEGAKYSGKGYVQLTGETNYEKLEDILRKQNRDDIEEFEKRTGQKFDLTDYAYQAKDPKLAFLIMTIGMFRGVYTGKAFRHYINDKKCDYYNARRIINGTDKAARIARVAQNFEKVLKTSSIETQIDWSNEVQVIKDSAPPSPEPETPANNESNQRSENLTTTTNEPTEKERAEPNKVDVETPEPYGFWKKIKSDLSWAFGGNVSLQAVKEGAQNFLELPVSKEFWQTIVYLALAFTAVYLIYRVVHYGLHVWKHSKTLTKQMEVNGNGDRQIELKYK